jgi:hypothetical protein
VCCAFACEFGCGFDSIFYVSAERTKIVYFGFDKYWWWFFFLMGLGRLRPLTQFDHLCQLEREGRNYFQ